MKNIFITALAFFSLIVSGFSVYTVLHRPAILGGSPCPTEQQATQQSIETLSEPSAQETPVGVPDASAKQAEPIQIQGEPAAVTHQPNEQTAPSLQ